MCHAVSMSNIEGQQATNDSPNTKPEHITLRLNRNLLHHIDEVVTAMREGRWHPDSKDGATRSDAVRVLIRDGLRTFRQQQRDFNIDYLLVHAAIAGEIEITVPATRLPDE